MNVAIISGASSGIGFEITKILDTYSLDELWLIASSKEKLENAQKLLKTPSKIFAIDLSNKASLDELANELLAKKPTVNYLVCSAGVGYNGRFEELSTLQIGKMIDINVRALTELTTICLPYVKESGKILEIASSAGFLPQPSFAVYSATKAYVISFSRAIREELRKKKISVTAVCPGPVQTPFFAGLENVKEYKKKYAVSPEKVAKCALKDVKKRKALSIPTFSMKMVHLFSKIIPFSIISKFYK